MNARGKYGGLLGLKADFEIVDKLLATGERTGENEVLKGTRESFHLILKVVQLSWGSFFDGQRAFQFQMCGRLSRMRNKDVIVDAVMNSFETHTAKPYLKPVSCLFPEVNSAQILEVPVGEWCDCVTCSPCGRYIAAGGGPDVVVADINTGDVLKRLHGHTADVTCITFVCGSKKIVSASHDRTVAMWEWEKSEARILVLEGHSGAVWSVAISRDGERIVSGSEDGT